MQALHLRRSNLPCFQCHGGEKGFLHDSEGEVGVAWQSGPLVGRTVPLNGYSHHGEVALRQTAPAGTHTPSSGLLVAAPETWFNPTYRATPRLSTFLSLAPGLRTSKGQNWTSHPDLTLPRLCFLTPGAHLQELPEWHSGKTVHLSKTYPLFVPGAHSQGTEGLMPGLRDPFSSCFPYSAPETAAVASRSGRFSVWTAGTTRA